MARIEVVSGRSLYAFEKENILDPLGMNDTGFFVPDAARQGSIAEPLPTDDIVVGLLPISDPRLPNEMGIRRSRHGLDGV